MLDGRRIYGTNFSNWGQGGQDSRQMYLLSLRYIHFKQITDVNLVKQITFLTRNVSHKEHILKGIYHIPNISHEDLISQGTYHKTNNSQKKTHPSQITHQTCHQKYTTQKTYYTKNISHTKHVARRTFPITNISNDATMIHETQRNEHFPMPQTLLSPTRPPPLYFNITYTFSVCIF